MNVKPDLVPTVGPRVARGDRPIPLLLQELLEDTGAAHASLLHHDPDRGRSTVTHVAGEPFVAAGMTLRTDDVSRVTSPRYGDCGTPLPLAFLAHASSVENLSMTAVRRHDGTAAALLLLGWPAGAPPVSHGTVVAGVERILPALTQAVTHDELGGQRIVVAHEDDLIAHGIARRVERESAGAVIACSTTPELRAVLERDDVSVLLCGDHLADGTPLAQVVAMVHEAGTQTRVVALYRTPTARTAAQARNAGADGFVALGAAPPELLSIIRRVRTSTNALHTMPPDPAAPPLTARELDLLRGLEEGLSYHQIAIHLGLALSTVKTHSRPLFRKLGVSSRAAAVHVARAEGLI